MFFNKAAFEAEHGYSPDNEAIPHMVQVCNRHGLAIKEFVATCYTNALAQIVAISNSTPYITEKEPVMYKILNVSVQDHPKHISRVTSIPDHMQN